MKKSIIIRSVTFAVMIIFLLMLCSCEDITKPEPQIEIQDEKPSSGGTMTIGSIEPNSLNPLRSNSRTYNDISGFIFEKLVDYDENLKIQPILAESWGFIQDTSEYVIKLKTGLEWSDGKAITSKDIEYSIDTIKLSDTSIYKNNIEHIYSYEVVDDRTINIKFDKAFANAIDMLSFPIIPQHVYSLNENAIPVCSGPYKIADYVRLKHMELEPNEKWLKINTTESTEQSKPYIKKIKVIFINDSDAFSTAFQTRELDVLNTLSYDWEKYSELNNVNTYKYTSMNYDFIGINHNNPVLKDKSIRKAILNAINRYEMIDKYLLGNAVITDMPLNPSSWLYKEKYKNTIFNKQEAENILKNAGFSDSDGDSILERIVDGEIQELRFSLMTNSENEFRKKAVEDIKQSLENIGFKVDIKYVLFSDMIKLLESKNFDAVLSGYNLSKSQDLSFAFHSTQIDVGKNYYSYSNSELDNLLYKAYTEVNVDDRKEIYNKITDVFVEELPCISLFFREGAIVARNKIIGDIKPDTGDAFRDIDKWFVSKQNQ